MVAFMKIILMIEKVNIRKKYLKYKNKYLNLKNIKN